MPESNKKKLDPNPVGRLSPKALKKAAEAAKLEEAARLEEEAIREEQERLAEQARFEQERKKTMLEKDTPEERIRDMMKWLNSIPLSQPCFKRIDREFSDGVLVSEVIAHYCPDLVDLRHFHRCHAYDLKLGNWAHLNRKVFPELGFKLKDDTIFSLMKPWGCNKHDPKCPKELQIYQVLGKVRAGLSERNPSVFDYREQPDTEIDCNKEKIMETKKISRPKTSNPLKLSVIEQRIEEGYYDKRDENVETISDDNSDWVNVYICGEQQIIEGSDFLPCCTERSCTAPAFRCTTPIWYCEN